MALGGEIKVEAVQVSLWRCRASLSDWMKERFPECISSTVGMEGHVEKQVVLHRRLINIARRCFQCLHWKHNGMCVCTLPIETGSVYE